MLNPVQKKIIIFVLFIALVIVMGFLLYSFFFKEMIEQPQTRPIATSTETGGGLPIAGEGGDPNIVEEFEEEAEQEEERFVPRDAGLVPSQTARGGLTETSELNKEESADPILSSDGRGVQYYNREDGKFYYIDQNGDIREMSDRVFHQVEKTTWAPAGNKAILEYPDGSNIVYDFESDRQVSLPKHWEEFNFSSNGDKIAMKSIGLDPNNRYLAVANADGSGAKIIDKIGENADDVYPGWSPNGQVVALFTEGVGFNRQKVYFIGQNNENFKSTTIEGRGLQFEWSPQGDKLLYSVYSSDNQMKPTLWMVDSQGESIGNNRQSLRLDTWAEKCNFHSGREIFCAVPDELEEGAGLFPELAQNTTDKLYRIDPETGVKKLLAIPESDYNISNIIISDDERTLYFTDQKTSRIHKINLK